jgi:hypothetical protein
VYIQVTSNIEARSLNHYCREKTICISYFLCVCVCVCVAGLSYPACNARAPYIVCVWAGCTVFFHIISKKHNVQKKAIEYKNVLFDFLYDFFLKLFSF